MELKFVSRDGDYLVFETPEGSRLRTLIDENLRDAIRKVQPQQEISFTPKEVQSHIRLGLSLEEVADKLGVPTSAIEPFALPIIDELRYVLDAALNTALPDGPTMKRFEDIVLLTEPEAVFRVQKGENGWEVLAQGQQHYSWLFDPKTRVIEPNSESARKIGKAASPKDSIFAPAPVIPEAQAQEQDVASVHDLVQELRSRREATQQELKPHSAKGRAALPSWDEIVLGTGSLETDTD